MARAAKVSIMLTQEMKQELKQLASSMGQTESALGSVIIGQWVSQYRSITNQQMNLMSADNVSQIVLKAISEGVGADRT